MSFEYKEDVLFDGVYLQILLTEIDNARYSIDLEVYIFIADTVGQLVIDALCRASKRGVKVRLLVDGVGSIDWDDKIATQLECVGISLRIYHPLPWRLSHLSRDNNVSNLLFSKLIKLFSNINSRNHRKVCIIDRSMVFVGSANIGNYLLDDPSIGMGWRETTIKLSSMNTEDIQFAFDKAWGVVSSKEYLRKLFTRLKRDAVFQLNYSWRLRHRYYRFLMTKIARSRRRIWVTNAYFIPDSYLLKMLIRASRKGVDVRILLPGRSDVAIVSLASTRFYSILIENGVSIYEYLPTVLHAKTLIIDDWHSVGSHNLNYRSFKHDLEVNVDVRTSEAKEILEKQFMVDLEKSRQLNMSDVANQSIFKKIAASLILLIRHWI